MDGGREKILVCETEGSSGTGSSDNRDCLGWQSASYRCEYNGVSVGVDFDGGGVCAEKRDVLGGPMSLDLKFDLVLGVCVDVTGEYTYAQERVVATAAGVGTVLLETGVSATIDYGVFLEAHAEAMRHLDDAGGEAKRWFLAAADGVFAAKRGRSITEQEKPEAYYRFAKDLHTGAAPVAQPDSFNVCEAYPWICLPISGGGASIPSFSCETQNVPGGCSAPSSELVCLAAVLAEGLSPGGCGGYDFAGDYGSGRGCYTYASGDYAGCGFWSTSGDPTNMCMDGGREKVLVCEEEEEQHNVVLSENCVSPTTEWECMSAALVSGLSLGGAGYDFAGDYGSGRGCYTYTSNSKYVGIAYWSTSGDPTNTALSSGLARVDLCSAIDTSGGGGGGSSCLFEAEVKIPVKVYVESDNLSGVSVDVGDPSFTSGTNVPQVTFEGKIQLAGEMLGTIYAGESIAVSTTCTTSSCSDPGGEVCVNAGVQLPNVDLPSTEICGRTIGFDDIEVGGIGGEVCICLPELAFC